MFNLLAVGCSLDELRDHLQENSVLERARFLDGKTVLHFVVKVYVYHAGDAHANPNPCTSLGY